MRQGTCGHASDLIPGPDGHYRGLRVVRTRSKTSSRVLVQSPVLDLFRQCRCLCHTDDVVKRESCAAACRVYTFGLGGVPSLLQSWG